MPPFRSILFRLQPFFRRRKIEAELSEEMQAHLEMQTDANVAAGMAPEEARYAALRASGGVAQAQERWRDERGIQWLEDLLRDGRHAFRSLAKAPGFAATAVLTLALGIGINAGVFSAFKGIALRPLPGVPNSRDLVTVLWTTSGGDKLTVSYVELRDFQQRLRTLSGLEGNGAMTFSLEKGQEAERVWGEFASGGNHALLGVKPHLGRMLLPEDDRFPGSPLVVVLSHSFWQREFGGDPGVVGRSVRLNGQPCTIIGVAAPDFAGTTVGFKLDLFVPTAAAETLRPFGGNSSDIFTVRGYRSLATVGRIRPGCTFAQARAEVAAVGAALAREFPKEYEGKSATLVSVLESPFGAQTYVGPMFTMMMGMTALVLLIMCANVANLLLARANAREHEIAIRCALGAGRLRLIRQMLAESLVLALCGGTLGGLLALSTPALLRAIWPATLRVPVTLNVDADATVLGFAVLASFASAFVFGLWPALQASRMSVVPALKSGRNNGAPARTWGRSVLVAAQVAISIPLLVSAGLLLRSAQRQKTAHFGFETSRIGLLTIDLRPNGYEGEKGRAFCDRLLEEIRRLPGVEAASLANQLPLQIVPRDQAFVDVAGYVRPPDESAFVLINTVTPDYFRTLRIPLHAGREFSASDRADGASVAIVNATMARRYWPGQDPIGRSFQCHGKPHTVVGVAPDLPYLSPAEAPRAHFYLPFSQHFVSELMVQVRTTGDPAGVLKPARACIARLDPHLPVYGIETISEYLDFALSLSTFAADGLLLAGGLGLVLTAIGVFGTVSFMVGRRTQEIGVRMALGASRTTVVGLVLRQGVALVAIGAGVGLMGAAAASGVLKSMLYRTTTADPLTYGVVLLTVGGTTLLACWLPARRAARVDPLIALRAE